MKFFVRYLVGKSHYRTKYITAKNLDDAEEKLDKKKCRWVDIKIVKEEK